MDYFLEKFQMFWVRFGDYNVTMFHIFYYCGEDKISAMESSLLIREVHGVVKIAPLS
jgi:hypothetical protein